MKKTLITYWGGKQRMLPHILPLIPTGHKLYCEPFVGGGAVFFAKKPSKIEVINDINRMVTNFYKQVKTNFDELKKLAIGTLHSRGLYQDAITIYSNPHLFSEVQQAWAFWVACNQGWCSKIGSWGYSICDNSSPSKTNSDRIKFSLETYADRLTKTHIECNDALKVIASRDRESSFFYLDPPYVGTSLGHYKGYKNADFEDLLVLLGNLKGKFLLSSYTSELLNKYTKNNNWKTINVKGKTMSSVKRKHKVEVLTMNY